MLEVGEQIRCHMGAGQLTPCPIPEAEILAQESLRWDVVHSYLRSLQSCNLTRSPWPSEVCCHIVGRLSMPIDRVPTFSWHVHVRLVTDALESTFSFGTGVTYSADTHCYAFPGLSIIVFTLASIMAGNLVGCTAK
jgi:hypothetical protein